jgi:hypothetical protein
MNRGIVRQRSGDSSWYQGELSPPAELDFAIRDLRARCERLKLNPADHELHNHCGAKVEHLKHLTDSLELRDEIREAAHTLLAETEQWLDTMPAVRRRLITSPYSDTW